MDAQRKTKSFLKGWEINEKAGYLGDKMTTSKVINHDRFPSVPSVTVRCKMKLPAAYFLFFFICRTLSRSYISWHHRFKLCAVFDDASAGFGCRNNMWILKLSGFPFPPTSPTPPTHPPTHPSQSAYTVWLLGLCAVHIVQSHTSLSSFS